LSRAETEAQLALRGVTVLFAVPWPPQGLYTVHGVESLRDFKGMRFRTYNPATVRIAELVQGQPTTIQLADLPKSLVNGQLDAMLTSSATGIEIKAWSRFKYYYDVNAWIPKNIVVVNTKAFDALDATTRQGILRAAGAAEERGWQSSRERDRSYKEQLAANGMKVGAPDWALAIGFRRMSEQFTREWLRSAGPSALNILLEYNLQKPKIQTNQTAGTQ
jgi:TRAP-type C4-dicarboxylate transport system substrate-binding protein